MDVNMDLYYKDRYNILKNQYYIHFFYNLHNYTYFGNIFESLKVKIYYCFDLYDISVIFTII